MRRAWIAALLIPAAYVAARSPLGADYGNLGCHFNSPRCDEPAWPLEALARGDFSTFVHNQPLMGPTSMILRAPFVAVASIFPGGLAWHYRAGVFACLVLSGLLALALARRSRALRHPRAYSAAVAVLAFANPLTVSAIRAGHPEELVAAAAVVASALLVLDARWSLAALALGLAVATKAWALLAVAPLLLTVPAPARRRFAAIGLLVALALYVPLALGDAGRFRTVVQAAGSLGSRLGEAAPPHAWFFVARTGNFVVPSEVRDGRVVYADAIGYQISPLVAHMAHALALAVAVALALAWWWRGGAPRPETLLLLLGAILLLRCILDPGNHLYYHAAAALALIGYDALRPGARLPWVSGGFIAALWVVTRINEHLRTDIAFTRLYLAVAVPAFALLVWLALRKCRHSRSTPLTPRSRISRRHATGSQRA